MSEEKQVFVLMYGRVNDEEFFDPVGVYETREEAEHAMAILPRTNPYFGFEIMQSTLGSEKREARYIFTFEGTPDQIATRIERYGEIGYNRAYFIDDPDAESDFNGKAVTLLRQTGASYVWHTNEHGSSILALATGRFDNFAAAERSAIKSAITLAFTHRERSDS